MVARFSQACTQFFIDFNKVDFFMTLFFYTHFLGLNIMPMPRMSFKSRGLGC
ncbi:hypothetical protein C900_01346 [Fulvivirga imtechensis AK7]|uniref:Uncharacterized protein n=1 Tax=Fulvivirga imtechensis AK7 TaxID=1237149 RepID=L8JXG3_9BACT|nr:hypothetical protein C900_01346 [Fulvivirga imtechensis AK7]